MCLISFLITAKDIQIPSVINIVPNAFLGCKSLNSVIISSQSKVIIIDFNACVKGMVEVKPVQP